MSVDLDEFLDGLTTEEALKFIYLFLAQNDEPEPPHVELGFASQNEAFAEVGRKFYTNPNTVKNERDAFDRHTNSSRVGWDKPLPPRLVPIFDKYASFPRDEMRLMSKAILSRDWGKPMAKLPDLPKIIDQCRAAVSAIDLTIPVNIRDDVWSRICEKFGSSQTTTVVDGKTLLVQSKDGQSIFISAQEILIAKEVVPYLKALTKYNEALNSYSKALGFDSRTSGDGATYFKKLPADNWEEILNNDVNTKTPRDVLKDQFPNNDDAELMDRFLSDADWSGIKSDKGAGRKFDRSTDWMNSGVLKVGNWVASASAHRDKLVRGLYEIEDLDDAIRPKAQDGIADAKPYSGSRVVGGSNFINYGAPGTGKSHKIKEQTEELGIIPTTTVFHPDVQNSDFIGTLKPVVTAGDVGYAFSPGPFLKAYVKAWSNPDKQVWLVIEELNRAPAAAVFGELFLLLDRKFDGSGEYPVDYPSLECEAWVAKNIPETVLDRPNGLKLPSNLTIAATLNSADQGVYPLDTAFRRRWTQNYMKLDYSQGPDKKVKFIDNDGAEQQIYWREFVKCLNVVMEAHGIREDRLLGPWFVTAHELESGAIPGKVLVYLWDDLFRNHDKSVVFSNKKGATYKGTTYGGLVDDIENGKPIFSDTLMTALIGAAEL